MTKLERIADVVENWRQGNFTATRAIIYIRRILEESE